MMYMADAYDVTEITPKTDYHGYITFKDGRKATYYLFAGRDVVYAYFFPPFKLLGEKQGRRISGKRLEAIREALRR